MKNKGLTTLKDPKHYTVYGLFDPRNAQRVRYIGFSGDPARRLRAHIKEARVSERNTHKLNWLRKVLLEAVSPLWRQIAVADSKSEAAKLEIVLIKQHRAAGHDLTNGTDGGDGSAEWTPRMFAERAELSRRYWAEKEAREQQRQAMKAFWSSPDGAVLKETHRTKATGKIYGKRSDESREKMRAAKLGKPQMTRTPEWKEKIASAQRGKPRKPWTPEERVRRMAAINHEKMSASAKARATRKAAH